MKLCFLLVNILLSLLTSITNAAISYLPFLNILNASTVDNILDYAEPVDLPSDIYFGSETYKICCVSTHGLMSFGVSTTAFIPSIFPHFTIPVVAPFWDDIDLTGLGFVEYKVVAAGDVNNITISQVKEFLKTNQSVVLDPDWILVAKWINVCPYRNDYCSSPLISPNTFQAVIVRESKISYVIFTYKCGHLQWTDYNATIGYNANPEFFYNHPLSGTSFVTDIDCLNYPSSEWTNLVYKISKSKESSYEPVLLASIATVVSIIFLSSTLIIVAIVNLLIKTSKKSGSNKDNDIVTTRNIVYDFVRINRTNPADEHVYDTVNTDSANM